MSTTDGWGCLRFRWVEAEAGIVDRINSEGMHFNSKLVPVSGCFCAKDAAGLQPYFSAVLRLSVR